MAKRARWGIVPVRRSDEAWAVVDARLAAGWSPQAIGSAAGIAERTIRGGLAHRDADGHHTWTSQVAEAIIASAPWPTAGRLPSTGVRRRLRALAAIGWTLDALHARSGIPMMTLSAVRSGRVETVQAANHARIRVLYDDLSMTPGPSVVARDVARAQRWAPPLGWDEETIDDPTATPVGVGRDRGLDEERLAALVAAGWSDSRIAEALGVTARTVIRQRQQHGLESRWSA